MGNPAAAGLPIAQNGQVVRQTWGNHTLDFVYDEQNRPRALIYDGTTYRYVLNQQGDVIGIVNTTNGATAAKYAYDAWGNMISGSGRLSAVNPLRYRGYYYDTETEFYYLQSRYYDPSIKRFINADNAALITIHTIALTNKNLFAYCDNNPVSRIDGEGKFWETIFDVVSLGASIVEVSANPCDPWAWAGLVGDALDLIPVVTGIGEGVRAVKTTVKVVENVDNVVDTAKAVYRTADRAGDIRRATGSYEILFRSGKNYVGKGGFGRAISSARRYADDLPVSIMWKSAPNTRAAFIDEFLMQRKRGVLSANRAANTYNKIWSPGRRLFLK